jgi:hypothetical protein
VRGAIRINVWDSCLFHSFAKYYLSITSLIEIYPAYSPAEVELMLFRGGEEPPYINKFFWVVRDDAGRHMTGQTPFFLGV